MRNKSNKVLVSAHQSSQSAFINESNHAKALEMLKREDANFIVVEGSYKGSKELTFLLEADDIESHLGNLEIATNLGTLFGQESFLEVHNDDLAVLHYLNGTQDNLGTFTEVDKDEALTHNSYTHVTQTDRYFVVK